MGINVVPIGSDILDITRWELAGMYTILCIAEYMVQYCNIHTPAIELGSNYESGLNLILLSTDKTPVYYIEYPGCKICRVFVLFLPH